eukprot:1150518-Pelagomonas_calceolata.AAC.2
MAMQSTMGLPCMSALTAGSFLIACCKVPGIGLSFHLTFAASASHQQLLPSRMLRSLQIRFILCPTLVAAAGHATQRNRGQRDFQIIAAPIRYTVQPSRLSSTKSWLASWAAEQHSTCTPNTWHGQQVQMMMAQTAGKTGGGSWTAEHCSTCWLNLLAGRLCIVAPAGPIFHECQVQMMMLGELVGWAFQDLQATHGMDNRIKKEPLNN